VGGVLSAVIAIKIKTSRPGLLAISMWSLFAAAPLALAFPISPEFVIFGYFIAGLSIGGWEAYWVTAVQREVPQDMQGRVFSIDMVGSGGLMPIGMALVGPAVGLFGERSFLLGAIIFHVIICYLVLLVPGVKELSDPRRRENNSPESEQSQA
jgi:MFS family permease